MTEGLEVQYRFAGAADEPALRELLARAALPTSDVSCAAQDHLLALRVGALVGSVGLEKHGADALLRSFAVAPELRGRGLGARLFERILAQACLRGTRRAFALTTTVERFCLRQGFVRVERSAAPEWLRAHGEFAALCPSTAVCLSKDLTAEARHFPSELLRLRPDVPGAAMWAVGLERAMLSYFELAPHARFEAHRHPAEQITLVLEGELWFAIGGRTVAVRPGEVIAIPSNVEHGAWTGEVGARAVDAWSPPRPEFLG